MRMEWCVSELGLDDLSSKWHDNVHRRINKKKSTHEQWTERTVTIRTSAPDDDAHSAYILWCKCSLQLDLTSFSCSLSLCSLSHTLPQQHPFTHSLTRHPTPLLFITITPMKTSFVVGLLSLAVASQAAMTR